MSKNNKNFSLSKWFDNKIFMVCFSIVLAVVVWAIVVFTISTETSATIKNVPITIPSQTLESLGLDVVDKDEHTVNVRVTGQRTVVSRLTADDFIITPSISNITEAGVYELTLSFAKANPNDDFVIDSISPTTVTLRFDVSENKRVTVEPQVTGLLVPEGYISGTITTSPSEINIYGPENEIASVARAVAYLELQQEITSSTTYRCDIVLLDAEGNEIPLDNIVMDHEMVELTIPVLKRATLPLDIGFINVPEGFDISTLNYSLSRSEIEIAAPEASVASLTTKIVGYIDLASFSLGDTYTFDVKLPNGQLNLDNVETVTASFADNDLTTAKLVVSDIRLDNAPSDYNVEVITAAINDVTVIGPADELETLSPRSVVAVVDLSQISIQRGEYTVPVSFVIPSSNSVWVIGNYSVLISVTPK